MIEKPLLTVVVPVHQSASTLRACCAALVASDLPREQWELIVIVDSCSDESMVIAAEFADVLVRLGEGPYGAAYARNRGAEMARAELVAFVSADVRVEPHTLRQFVATLESAPVAAVTVVGAPADGTGIVARYDIGCSEFAEMRSGGPSDAFTACCAAVRREAYMDAGLFDEWRTGSPRTEALEFGHRLRARGSEILRLTTGAPVRHARATSFRSLLRAAWHDHGETAPDGGVLEPVRNTGLHAVRRVERLTIVLVWLSILALAWAAVQGGTTLRLVAAGAFAAALLLDVPRLRHLAASGPWYHAPVLLLLHPLVLLVRGAGFVTSAVSRHLVGERRPAAHIEAWAEVGATRWPPVPNRRPTDTRTTRVLPS